MSHSSHTSLCKEAHGARSGTHSVGRRQFMTSVLGAGALLAPLGLVISADSVRKEHEGAHDLRASRGVGIWRERVLIGFGTKLWLGAAHTDLSLLERALDAAVQRLRHIESVMSLYQAQSQVCQLNRHGFLHEPDADMLRVLRQAQRVSASSDGAFDVTVQPLWTLWQTATMTGKLPDAAAIRVARSQTGWHALSIDDKRISFNRPGMGITLNGIAQGYACDQAREVLSQYGIEHALLDLGEWSSLGSRADIGVAHPKHKDALLATVALQSRAGQAPKSLATSSDEQMSFTEDRRFHHIFDPGTGASPGLASSVSVIAESCALADALTKVFFMSAAGAEGFESWVVKARALCTRWGVDAVIADKEGRTWSSLRSV